MSRLRKTSDSRLEYGRFRSRLRSRINCQSLLKICLTEEVFHTIKDRRTRLDGTLYLLVQSGMENPESEIGVYASDPAAYHTFSPLFTPIILSYHHLKPNFKQPPLFYGNPTNLCARSIKGFPLNPLLTKDQYLEIEKKVLKIISETSTGIEGTYRSLSHISEPSKEDLIRKHYLFKGDDRFLQAAHAYRHWSYGRGIFLNATNTLGVWINEEDRLRIFSMQDDANLPEIYARLVTTLKYLESKLEFVRDEKLGYLTFCPSNIGTTIRASVHIRLPKLAENREILNRVAENYGLQVKGTNGEHSTVIQGIFDISNKGRCGFNEFEVVQRLQEGILQMIHLEQFQSQ